MAIIASVRMFATSRLSRGINQHHNFTSYLKQPVIWSRAWFLGSKFTVMGR